MVCIHANQIKIYTSFVCPQVEQEFLFLSEGLLSTHFALLSAFLKWKKGVFKAGLSPLSTLAASLLFPRKSVIQRSGIQSLAQFGTYPVTEELMHTAWMTSAGEKKRHLLVHCHSPPFLVRVSRTCSFHSLCIRLFLPVKQFHSPKFHVVHRWTPGVATPLRSILPKLCQWMSFPTSLWKLLHRLGICISSQLFSTRNLVARNQKACITIFPCPSAAPHSRNISHGNASFETSAWQPAPVSHREPEKYHSFPAILLRHLLSYYSRQDYKETKCHDQGFLYQVTI